MSDQTVPGRRKRRLLTPEEKWEAFLEVTSRELTQSDAARKWGVDTSVVIKLDAMPRTRRWQRSLRLGRAGPGIPVTSRSRC